MRTKSQDKDKDKPGTARKNTKDKQTKRQWTSLQEYTKCLSCHKEDCKKKNILNQSIKKSCQELNHWLSQNEQYNGSEGTFLQGRIKKHMTQVIRTKGQPLERVINIEVGSLSPSQKEGTINIQNNCTGAILIRDRDNCQHQLVFEFVLKNQEFIRGFGSEQKLASHNHIVKEHLKVNNKQKKQLESKREVQYVDRPSLYSERHQRSWQEEVKVLDLFISASLTQKFESLRGDQGRQVQDTLLMFKKHFGKLPGSVKDKLEEFISCFELQSLETSDNLMTVLAEVISMIRGYRHH